MCSLAVSTLDSPAGDRSSKPGSGKILMSENLGLYTTSPVVIINKAFSSADRLHCKRDALSSNRKVDGSRLTGSTYSSIPFVTRNKDTDDGIASEPN